MSSTGLARSHGDSEDGVCAQAALVLSSVKLQHQVVDGSLQKYSCIIQIVSHYKNGTLVVPLYMTILRSFWGMGVGSTTCSASGSAQE